MHISMNTEAPVSQIIYSLKKEKAYGQDALLQFHAEKEQKKLNFVS